MSERHKHYALVAILLHWIMAAGIVFMIWLGWNMDQNESLYQLHKSIGITLLMLTVARLIWRLMNPPPPLPDEMSSAEKTASQLVHAGFYVLMLAMPLTGWALVSTSYEFDVPTVLFGSISWPDLPGLSFLTNPSGHAAITFGHSKLAWLAIGLFLLHIGGALKHEFGPETGVLKRMLPSFASGKSASARPGNIAAFILAFGSALGVFLSIAFLPGLFKASQARSMASDPTEIRANWVIDHSRSAIRFSGLHDGSPYQGAFGEWTAQIDFQSATPARARIAVNVDMTSVETNKKLYTDSLLAREWFNTDLFPTARIDILDIEQTSAQTYSSTARLSFKDRTVSVPFSFQLSENETETEMTGTAQLQRQALDLGQSSDPGADWVAETILVDVRVVASPIQ